MDSGQRASVVDFKIEIARRRAGDPVPLAGVRDLITRRASQRQSPSAGPGWQLKPLPIARHIKTWWVPQ